MIIIPVEDMIGVDVDETLVCAATNDNFDFSVEDPYGVLTTQFLKKHNPNINCIKRGHGRGHRYFVWSRAGVKWAELIVKTLKLVPYVELVMAKPHGYIDDKECQEWMGARTYLAHDLKGWDHDTNS